jgi:hypothetical protein
VRTVAVVYNACVTNRTGAIKIVSAGTSCAANQHKIAWNKTGPRGLTGPPGPPGPAGVVTGYQATNSTAVSLSIGGLTTVDSLQLPTGNFLVTARAQAIISGTQGADNVQCNLVDGHGDVVDFDSVTLLEEYSGQGIGNLVVTGLTGSGGTMVLECTDATGEAVVGSFARTVITAIPVS